MSEEFNVNQVIQLIAGAFNGPGVSKQTITEDDLNVIKALVGVAFTDKGKEIYDMNEYAGIDAGDLATVRRFIGKLKQVGNLTLPSGNIS